MFLYKSFQTTKPLKTHAAGVIAGFTRIQVAVSRQCSQLSRLAKMSLLQTHTHTKMDMKNSNSSLM